jgi:hypothetical protein
MKIIFAIFTFLMITTNAYAQKSYGVDFKNINWAKLCPSVESVPMQFKYNFCPVVHPATNRFYTSGVGGPEHETKDCEIVAKSYQELIHEQKRYGGWKHCKNSFQHHYRTMMTSPENYSDDEVVSFRDKFLSEGVYDAGYVRNLRSQVRAEK